MVQSMVSLAFIGIVLFAIVSVAEKNTICIVGGGIGGTSLAHFISNFSRSWETEILLFDENIKVGGRASLVKLSGDYFESGASIIHDSNAHLANFCDILNLNRTKSPDGSFGIWSGFNFLYKDIYFGSNPLAVFFSNVFNSLQLVYRYGYSELASLQIFIKELLGKWSKLYEASRPSFLRPDDLLESVGLYDLTQGRLKEFLEARGLHPRIIEELITMVLRVNYGQDTTISGLAGAVGLAGTGGELWSVEGGNYQIAEGLLNISGANFLPNHKVVSVVQQEIGYLLTAENSEKQQKVSYKCDAVALASPLEESHVEIYPPVELPKRRYQHTFVTFIRGHLNSGYFGLEDEDVPSLIGTVESPSIPFSSISLLKRYNKTDAAYKVFSRTKLSDDILRDLFLIRRETIVKDWAAYPHFNAPEKFSPFLLDGKNLYYLNSFENAASAMETAAVAAHNVAKLLSDKIFNTAENICTGTGSSTEFPAN